MLTATTCQHLCTISCLQPEDNRRVITKLLHFCISNWEKALVLGILITLIVLVSVKVTLNQLQRSADITAWQLQSISKQCVHLSVAVAQHSTAQHMTARHSTSDSQSVTPLHDTARTPLAAYESLYHILQWHVVLHSQTTAGS